MYKANSMKFKVSHFAPKKAGNDYNFWQNPIDHKSKSEIMATLKSAQRKTKSPPNVMKALKKL